MRDRKPFEDAAPINRDLEKALLLIALLFLGGFHVLFLYAFFVAVAVFAALLGLRGYRRHRVERANDDAAFWLDRMGGPKE